MINFLVLVHILEFMRLDVVLAIIGVTISFPVLIGILGIKTSKAEFWAGNFVGRKGSFSFFARKQS